MIHDLADKEAPRKSQWPFIGADSLLPGPRVGPQKRPRWECNSPGIISPAISTRCDEPLDIRVQIGLESTLGLLTLARTDKLSLFVVHACLRECQVPKSTDFGSVQHIWSLSSKPSLPFGQSARTMYRTDSSGLETLREAL